MANKNQTADRTNDESPSAVGIKVTQNNELRGFSRETEVTNDLMDYDWQDSTMGPEKQTPQD